MECGGSLALSLEGPPLFPLPQPYRRHNRLFIPRPSGYDLQSTYPRRCRQDSGYGRNISTYTAYQL